MGYKPWEFKRLKWDELWYIIKGYQNKTTREREERAYYWRELYALFCNIYRGEHDDTVLGSDIYPLSADKHTKAIRKPSDEVLRQMQELTNRMNNGN